MSGVAKIVKLFNSAGHTAPLVKIEIKEDAYESGSKILLIDDLIATGGTALAACNLLKKTGADIVECSFIIDLPDVGGAQKLKDAGYKVYSICEFEGD